MTAALARDNQDESGESFTNRPSFSSKPCSGLSVDNWTNNTKDGPFTTTTIETSWKDDKNEWQKRKISVTADQLAHLMATLPNAYAALQAEKSKARAR